MRKILIILFLTGCCHENKREDIIKTATLKEWFISRYPIDTIYINGEVVPDSVILECLKRGDTLKK